VAYELIIFDLDGTLIDSVGDIADALNAALAESGLRPLSDAETARAVGSGVRALVTRALDMRAPTPPATDLIDTVEAAFRGHYSAEPLRRTSLYLGARETLARLDDSGTLLAVATNKPGALARAILDGLGVGERFASVIGEDDVGARKPDPLMIDVIRGKLGVGRRGTLYVGDSLVDADTADAAGVDLALVGYGYAPPEAIAARAAKHHISRLSELVALAQA
jgi:phosphoglycolate phosphatase